MAEENKTWYETARTRFQSKSTFKDISSVVWDQNRQFHDFYQHYTTLSNVVTKILSERWWLSRSDSDRINDRQESLKFGVHSVYKRVYQASFVHGVAESAALWGMYVPEDPFAVRITIAGEAIRNWVDYLKDKDLHSAQSKCAIWEVGFKDIIYAAVGFRDKEKTRLDVKRNNCLYWSEVNSKSDLPNLEKDIKGEECTGWMKDYEWRHERESRLCVRVEQKRAAKAMWIPVSKDLIKSMKFTFSPWLDKSCESEVEGIIRDAYESRFDADELKTLGLKRKFHRSVLQGAMKLRCGRVKRD